MLIKSIHSLVVITNTEDLRRIAIKENICSLGISAYIEEESLSRHISFNVMAQDIDEHEGFDIFLDLDIYQAELFGRKILELVQNRKTFLENKFNK